MTSSAKEEVCLDLEYSGYIPDEYISDKSEKMAVYKRIASIRSEEDYDLAQAEIDDRYGPLPPAVASLFAVARIKLLAEKLGIVSIRERGGFADIVFGKISLLDPGKTVRLIAENPDSVIPPPRPPFNRGPLPQRPPPNSSLALWRGGRAPPRPPAAAVGALRTRSARRSAGRRPCGPLRAPDAFGRAAPPCAVILEKQIQFWLIQKPPININAVFFLFQRSACGTPARGIEAEMSG